MAAAPKEISPEDIEDFAALEALVRRSPTKLSMIAQLYRENEKNPIETHRSLHYLWIEYANYLCQ